MTPQPSGVTDVGDAPTSPAAQYLPDAASGVAPAVDDTGHTTVEHAILCADGRMHYGPSSLRGADLMVCCRVADADRWSPVSCGGAPHVLNARQRTVTVTAWEPVQTGGGAA